MADCSTEEATQAIHELGESDFRLDHDTAVVARISTALATSQARVAELEKTLTREGSKRALVKADLLEAHEALAELRSQWPKMMDIIADKDKRIAELEADREHLEEGARVLIASHKLGLLLNTAYGAALDNWLFRERARKAKG